MGMIYGTAGDRQQIEVTLENTVKAAKAANTTVRDYVNSAYATDAEKYGDAFSQLCASEGLVLQPSRAYGIKAPSLAAVLEGGPSVEAGAIVRTPSSQARVLLMPAIGALVEDKLLADLSMNANAFDSMVAMDTVIADEWYLWPEANFAGPEAGRSQVTSQLAKPVNMLTLTTSEKSLRIPTYAMGVEWSEQSAKYLSLDFIALSIARQVAVERNERANRDLLAMLNGDADVGQGALSGIAGKVKTAVSLDAAATTGITQKAWMLWLYNNSKKGVLSHVITDVLGAIAIEARSGRPVTVGDNGTSTRINTNESVMNPTWGNDIQVFITDDVNWPSKTIMGIRKDYAIQRVTSSNASYQAQEDFVLRRASAMRFDYGSVSRRLYNDAFEVLTFA